MDELAVTERREKMDTCEPTKDRPYRCLDVRVQMDRVRDLDIRMALDESADRPADGLDRFAEILATMRGEQDQPSRGPCERQGGVAPAASDPLDGIDDRIAGEKDLP